jgi:hypothetical protein
MKSGWYRLPVPYSHLYVELSATGVESRWANAGISMPTLYYPTEAALIASRKSQSHSRVLCFNSILSTLDPLKRVNIEALIAHHMGTSAVSGTMVEGWYRLTGDHFEHLYVHMTKDGESHSWVNANSARPELYFDSFKNLDAKYPYSIRHSVCLSKKQTDDYYGLMEDIRKKYMGSVQAVPSAPIIPKVPDTLFALKVDIGPLDPQVALNTFGPAQMAKERLGKLVKSSIQEWPHKKELGFRFADGNVETYWVDIPDEE